MYCHRAALRTDDTQHHRNRGGSKRHGSFGQNGR